MSVMSACEVLVNNVLFVLLLSCAAPSFLLGSRFISDCFVDVVTGRSGVLRAVFGKQ